MKTEQQLPKNIRQIGSPAGHTKVYIEDYVITFLNSLSMDKNTYVSYFYKRSDRGTESGIGS